MTRIQRVFIGLGCALVVAACGGTAGDAGTDATTDVVRPSDAADVPLDAPLADLLEDVTRADLVADLSDAGIDPADAAADVVADAAVDIAELAGPDVPADVDATLHEIVIDEPAEGATVRGSIRVRLRADEIDEWPGVHVVLLMDGVPIFTDAKLPTELVLDTTEHPNGPHALEATVTVEENTARVSRNLVFENPAYRFAQVTTDRIGYADGSAILVDVDLGAGGAGLTLTADFGALDSEYRAGAEQVTELGEGRYQIAYTLSVRNAIADGAYPVAIRAAAADGDSIEYDNLLVPLWNTPPTPVEVLGAVYVDEPMPVSQAGAVGRPTVQRVDGPSYIITGGTAQIGVTATDTPATDIIGLVVGVEGYAGYFQVPLPAALPVIPATLRLDPNAGIPGRIELRVRVAVVDRAGNVSEYVVKAFNTIEVLSGDVQVSVSFDPAQDIDLHVIEPSGEEIYYGHRNSATGGVLDLDSNAACGQDYVNNENISWPPGQSPPGCYAVRVDYWASCDGGGASYTVTVKNCGQVSVFNGTFHSGDADHGGQGSGVTVAEFCNTCGFVAEGYVRYEDRTFNADGFRARTWKPARFVTVEARRNADGVTLGTARTDRFGYYRLNFDNDGAPGFYVVVKTQSARDEELRDITVYNHPKFGRIYEFLSEIAYEQTGVPTLLDLDIPIAQSAGALNIYDVALDGYDRIRRMTGKELGPLRLYWQTGADTTETLYCSTDLFGAGLCDPEDSLQINGLDTNRDEYDDCVILRQVYKFAESKISATNSPGGEFDGTRADPRRSWSEGMATFFSCQTRRTPLFVNSNHFGVYRNEELEVQASPFAFRTRNGAMQGAVSELLVAAVLWDLVDGTTDDPVTGNANGLYDAAFNYLGGEAYIGGRGFPGRDFTDFLDGWLCRGHGQREELRTVLEEREFPYDFAGPETCP